jgi:hypothetical protein
MAPHIVPIPTCSMMIHNVNDLDVVGTIDDQLCRRQCVHDLNY